MRIKTERNIKFAPISERLLSLFISTVVNVIVTCRKKEKRKKDKIQFLMNA